MDYRDNRPATRKGGPYCTPIWGPGSTPIYTRFPREAIAALDLQGFDTIVVSHLGSWASPSRLIRRLRQNAPQAKILVAPWDEASQRRSGAQESSGDYGYSQSLGNLVGMILDTGTKPASL
jgi:hypothetical protein